MSSSHVNTPTHVPTQASTPTVSGVRIHIYMHILYVFGICTGIEDVASSSQKKRRFNRCASSWRSIQTRHTVKAGRGAKARVVDEDAVHIRVVVGRVERLLQVRRADLHRTGTVNT
jgi:hypothetical protein